MELSHRLRDALGSPAVFWGMATALVFDLFSLLALVIRLRPASFQVPLHYTSRSGVDLTGPWYSLFYLPLVGLLVIGVNTWVIARIKRRGLAPVYFLVAVTVLVEILVLITTFLFLGRL